MVHVGYQKADDLCQPRAQGSKHTQESCISCPEPTDVLGCLLFAVAVLRKDSRRAAVILVVPLVLTTTKTGTGEQICCLHRLTSKAAGPLDIGRMQREKPCTSPTFSGAGYLIRVLRVYATRPAHVGFYESRGPPPQYRPPIVGFPYNKDPNKTPMSEKPACGQVGCRFEA